MRIIAMLALLAATAGTAAMAATPCAAPQFHQFDFWIGSWNVTSKDNEPAGVDKVESRVNGCALVETWEGKGGGTGVSLNYYDPEDGKWHQEWVGTGARLHLVGGLEGERMVLAGGPRTTRKGTLVEDRITWEPRPDGSVLQEWRVSPDRGKSWKVIFSGTYRKEE
ncbi:MAG TPA: hypothetical protein VKA53_10970 [Thermoanaerobaculia bacterium]|nr:hypothetical protein [Thermoanaerobaculia bacterium]